MVKASSFGKNQDLWLYRGKTQKQKGDKKQKSKFKAHWLIFLMVNMSVIIVGFTAANLTKKETKGAVK
jgi:hypothetical protein